MAFRFAEGSGELSGAGFSPLRCIGRYNHVRTFARGRPDQRFSRSRGW